MIHASKILNIDKFLTVRLWPYCEITMIFKCTESIAINEQQKYSYYIELLGLQCPINCDLHMALKLISSQTWFPNPNSRRQDVHREAKPTEMSIWYACTCINSFIISICTSLDSGYFSKGLDTWDIKIPTQTQFLNIFLYFKVIKIYYFVFHMICHNYQKISISDKEIKKALGGKLATYTLTTKRSLSCLRRLDFKTKFEETCFVQTKCWSFRKKQKLDSLCQLFKLCIKKEANSYLRKFCPSV